MKSRKLPPLPQKYRTDAEFVDHYELRTGLLGIAIVEGLLGAALLGRGLLDESIVELAAGAVLLVIAFVSGIASGGFLNRPRGRLRSLLAELPLLAAWFVAFAILVFLAYAFLKTFLAFGWSLLVLVGVVALLAGASSRLGILDHARLHSWGLPFGQNQPMVQGHPDAMPPDPVRHRERDRDSRR